MKTKKLFLAFLTLVGVTYPAQFAQKPAITESGDSAFISFSVSASIDVEVAILSSDGKVVRHLAAGVLGADSLPPAPLTAGLSQSLVWNGRDDDGNRVYGEPFSVRVRLGVSPKFEKRISSKVYPSITGLYFWSDTSHVYPGNLGTDSNISIDTFIPMTHPFFRQNKGHYQFPATWPDGTVKIKLYEGGPKLDMTVSDLDEKIVIQSMQENQLGFAAATIDGVTGQTLKIWKMTPTTMFGGAQMWYYGEPAFDYHGRFILRDDGSLTPGIWRLTPEGSPLPFASGSNGIVQAARSGSDMRQRGLTTDRHGNIYHGHQPRIGATAIGPTECYNISKFDSNGVLLTDSLFQIWGNIGQGIRVDPNGNYFLGLRVRPYPDTVPASIRNRLEGLATDKYSQAYWARVMYGSIVKFGPQGGKVYPDAAGALMAGPVAGRASAANMKWMHFGASMQPSHSSAVGATCVCYTPRFDVDRYGRVIFPNGFENEFKALDNNGNLIFRIHNRDLLNQIKIGLIHNVQVTDRGIYCADYINNQVVCFAWKADAETSLTLVSAGAEVAAGTASHFVISPNPFARNADLRFTLKNRNPVEVSILDARGRMVRALIRGTRESGSHIAAWDGRDNRGLPAAAGVYCFVLKAGDRTLTRLALLAR